MKLKIHRGTKEIGGSCVEVWTSTTRIVIDIGMPLLDNNGDEFNQESLIGKTTTELISEGILPNIPGFYYETSRKVDGVLISHAHKDHYGFGSYLLPDIRFYLGKATHEILKINKIFIDQSFTVDHPKYFTREKPFMIGDISVTPYWADHSAFDAYSFLIEAEGKRIFYTGDFRGHGRKHKVFKWFTHNAPENIDYLIMEGTQVGYYSTSSVSENNIEEQFKKVFEEKDKVNFVYCSGQNIDRLVSLYRACLATDKTLVVDVFVAHVLKTLSRYAGIPYPSREFGNLRVVFPWHLTNRLAKENKQEIFYQFKHFKITKKEIGEKANEIVMVVRPSMQFDLTRIKNISDGNFIYSLWKGYLDKPKVKGLRTYLSNRNFTIHYIHTSGHADINTLKKMVEVINPRYLVPIHTMHAEEYNNQFPVPILEAGDGQEIVL